MPDKSKGKLREMELGFRPVKERKTEKETQRRRGVGGRQGEREGGREGRRVRESLRALVIATLHPETMGT